MGRTGTGPLRPGNQGFSASDIRNALGKYVTCGRPSRPNHHNLLAQPIITPDPRGGRPGSPYRLPCGPAFAPYNHRPD